MISSTQPLKSMSWNKVEEKTGKQKTEKRIYRINAEITYI